MDGFDQQYINAETGLRDDLKSFRDRYTEKYIHYGDHDWSYYDIGDDDHVILWLVGGLRMGDAAFRSIPIMADAFRIILPSYPSVQSMAGLTAGLREILKQENIKSCSILAGSFGGMIAQVFVRHYPKAVNKLILSTTTAPNPALKDRYQQQLEMISSAPEELVREGAKTQMFSMINPPKHEANFWKAYLDELYSHRLGKADLINTYHCLIDYMTRYEFSADDLEDWHGDILILESDNDNVFGTSERQTVNDLYPQAHSHTFIGAGHSPASTQRDVYFDIVRKFLHE